jgi:hypothetical protein
MALFLQTVVTLLDQGLFGVLKRWLSRCSRCRSAAEMAAQQLVTVQRQWQAGAGCESMQMVRTVSCSSALQGRRLQD